MATKTEDKQYPPCIGSASKPSDVSFKHIQEHGVNDKKVDIPRKLTGAPGQLQVLLVGFEGWLAEALGLLTGELKPPQKNNDPESSEQDATDTDPDSSDDEPEEDVITATADEVGHSISSLFRLTANIQNLASRDRMERIEKIDVSAFGPFDINHVRDKYGLGEDAQYLIERLGKANTKRRQLLKYNEQHHDKIAGRRKDDTGNPGNTDSTAGAEADHQDEG
ncbi:hypothetical protein BZA77DRAFT_361001 [Pyronema omphalodes]|nr:hypothetical protein BZA77DRAFT_361001 [Pyronema omphalodes]